MEPIETVVTLLFCAIALGLCARRMGVPYPVALVFGGLILAFVPGPAVRLDSALALALFLPPILYQAALKMSWRDVRENIGSISLLATALVLFTTVVVAALVHLLLPAMGWRSALVLGAIVSPSDAVAATAVMQRFNISRRIIAVVEGESLINDATGLVLYKYATAAVVSGLFSLPVAAADFLLLGVGGAALGALSGWIFANLQRRVDDALIESTASLIFPFVLYIVSQYLGISGVLAVVAGGLVRGHYYPEILSARTRMQSLATWDVVVFVLNSLSFVLIGLQLHGVLAGLSSYSTPLLIGDAVAVSVAVMGSRILWVFATAYLRPRAGKARPNFGAVAVVAWTGMRGIVSLAASLALPLQTDAGRPFPGRELIIFFSFTVILSTLAIQGLSLGSIIRWLGLKGDSRIADEEAAARLEGARAALAALAEFSQDESIDRALLHRLRADYERRIVNLHDASVHQPQLAGFERAQAQLRKMRLAALTAQRRSLVSMRNQLLISDEVLHLIEHELDLQELEEDSKDA